MTSPAEALSAALVAEHAAIYGYDVLGPHLSGVALAQAQAAETVHRARRDDLLLRLANTGTKPPAPAVAYTLPFPVTDAASAQRLAVQLEERTAAIWRVAIGPTSDADRKLALDALVDSALRAARWRRLTGAQPGTVALP